VAAIARLVHEHDTLLWRILRHYTEQAHHVLDLSDVQAVGMDETASKRGQHYVSLFVDMDEPRVIFATPGRDARTLKAFSEELQAHGGDPEDVEEVCCDLSAAFIAGVQKHLPQASITFDKYHVMKIINDALDHVRRHEQRQRPELKKTRYIWLKNRDGLKDAQAERLARKSHRLGVLASGRQMRADWDDVNVPWPVLPRPRHNAPLPPRPQWESTPHHDATGLNTVAAWTGAVARCRRITPDRDSCWPYAPTPDAP
jgi:transposase